MPRRGERAVRARQRGQAIAFVLVTTVIVLLGVVLLYNVSQLTTQKMKLQNTADAAAYSGAVTEARDYNFTSYANRAIVANQVAIAQIVGLTSWSRNLDSAFKSGPMAWMPETMANLSFLSFMYTIPANIIKAIAGPLKTGVETAGKILTIALDALVAGLYYATTAFHAGMILTVPQTVSDVVTANDPDAQVSLSATQIGFAAKHLYDWYSFTTDGITDSYDATATTGGKLDSVTGGAQDRMANVIYNSQDGFASRTMDPGNHRSYPWTSVPVLSPFLIDPTKFFVPFNNGPALMFMYHSGGTELKTTNAGKKHRQWAALDATGLFTLFVVWIMIVLVPVPIPIPIPTPQGWGGALAGAAMTTALQPNLNFNHNFAQSWGSAFVNPLTIAPAGIQAAQGPGATLDGSGGLKINYALSSYLDVKNRGQASSTANQNTSGPELVIEVRKVADTVRTSTTMSIGGGTGGQLYLEDGTEGNHIKAISKAHAYFSRPKKLFPRAIDSKTEYGSLYSPYWQARLLPSSLLEQGASILTQ